MNLIKVIHLNYSSPKISKFDQKSAYLIIFPIAKIFLKKIFYIEIHIKIFTFYHLIIFPISISLINTINLLLIYFPRL